MIRVFVIVSTVGLHACATVLSEQSFRAVFPEQEQLSKIEIGCSNANHWPPESKTEVVYESDRLTQIRNTFVAVSDGWQHWGIVTLPAAEIRIMFVDKSGNVHVVSTASDFRVIWNERGWRRLDMQEISAVSQAVPRC